MVTATGKLHAAPGLKGLDHGVEAPGVDLLLECLFQAVKTLGVFDDGTDVCLKDNVLSRCRTDDLREPSEMGWVPGGPARVADIVSEQEGVETTLGGLKIADGIFTRPGEIPHGFVFLLGNRDQGEITGAPQAGPLHRVTAVGFDAVAGLFRHEGGRHHPAVMASFCEIPVEPVATGIGCIDKDQMLSLGWHLADEVVNVTWPCADGTTGGALGSVLLSDGGHGDGRFMDISSDVKRARLGQD
jgi:hypothetical protein